MMASHAYSVYGVDIRSAWPLAFPPSTDGPATGVRVDFVAGGDADFSDIRAPRAPIDSWFESHFLPDGSTYFRWSDLYEFRIPADGSRVVCRPLNGTDPLVLQNFLFGPAISFALVHQGLEPLHATAVEMEGTAIGFLGDCTFGKSTMLASFLQAGHRLLTDDLLMLVQRDRQWLACPGSGRIKLHPDSAHAFLDDVTHSEPLHAFASKRSFPVDATRSWLTALPLTRLFVLPTPDERARATSVSIEPLSRAALFHELLKNSFNVDVVTRDRFERQFGFAARLAGDIDGFRLQYPEGFSHLSLGTPLHRRSHASHRDATLRQQMNETKTSRANSASPRKPYTPPRLVSYGHVKDVIQTGGGGMNDGTDTSKTMCWVAEALYGASDARTLALRSWLTGIHAARRQGWVFVELYRRFGQRVAALIVSGLIPRAMLLPLFDVLADRAFDESARTIVHGRHRRAV